MNVCMFENRVLLPHVCIAVFVLAGSARALQQCPPQQQNPCPPGSSGPAAVISSVLVNPANSRRYVLLSPASWTMAEAAAIALGGHLVTINDAAEDAWVKDTFRSFGGVDRALWIGMSDHVTEGTWVWSSGEPVTYAHWGAGEPNDCHAPCALASGEDFGHIFPAACNVAGVWNDVDDSGVGCGGEDFKPNGVVELDDSVPPCSETVFDNYNVETVANNPPNPTVVTFAEPVLVTYIATYHWNGGTGATPGGIGLQPLPGGTPAVWAALPYPSPQPNTNWYVTPDVVMPAGTYAVFDTNPQTWSHNAASGNSGFAVVAACGTTSHEPLCLGDGTGAACPCAFGQSGAGCANSTGNGAVLTAVGSNSVMADDLSLACTGMLPGSFCLFSQGTLPLGGGLGVQSPTTDGLDCVGGSKLRLGIKPTLLAFPSQGAAQIQNVASLGVVPSIGGTRYYQVVYRNQLPYCTPATLNGSNGIEIVWRP